MTTTKSCYQSFKRPKGTLNDKLRRSWARRIPLTTTKSWKTSRRGLWKESMRKEVPILVKVVWIIPWEMNSQWESNLSLSRKKKTIGNHNKIIKFPQDQISKYRIDCKNKTQNGCQARSSLKQTSPSTQSVKTTQANLKMQLKSLSPSCKKPPSIKWGRDKTNSITCSLTRTSESSEARISERTLIDFFFF